ncbi:MAG: DUF433 domain-containing protein [Anaerolineae bacterium]|jgi:uncharacterized protein (DUF433 family)
METMNVRLPESLYEVVAERAAARQQTPDSYVQELLVEHLNPSHPYVEIVQSRSAPRAMIKGTRIGVDIVVGYTQADYSPTEIAEDILPHLTLAQIYDALSFYQDHRSMIDEALQTNTMEAWRERLRQRLGAEAMAQLLGN